MKKIVIVCMLAVTMLLSLGGCHWYYYDHHHQQNWREGKSYQRDRGHYRHWDGDHHYRYRDYRRWDNRR